MGPAERADVIVDFSTVAPGTNVILYNDAPAPVPGFQPRYDYYTGNPDQTATGGAPQTQVGVGPNTRTIMQFRVAGTPAPRPLIWPRCKQPCRLLTSRPSPRPSCRKPIIRGLIIPPSISHVTINATSLTYTPVGSAAPKTLVRSRRP